MGSEKKGKNRYLVLFVLCLGAAVCYLLPYLRWTFYDPMIEAFGFNNTELSSLGSIYGVVAMISYFFGGPIADKVAPKYLLSIAFALTGITGFWFATFPGYAVCAFIMGVWAVTSTLFMWDCMMRVTRTLGSSEEQGRLFGFLEGGRGLCSAIVSFALVAVIGLFANQVAGLQGVIIVISVLNILVAVLAWFVLPGEVVIDEGEQKFQMKDILKVFKIPAVWVIALVILCCYSVFLGTTYFTPYLTEVFGMTVAAAAVIATIRTYVLQLFGGPVGGIIADKITISKTITISFVVIVVGTILFAIMPSGASVMILMVVLVVTMLAIYFMRGIYFASVDEVSIPLAISGTAIGIISFIGFFPDVYMNIVAGMLLDATPGAGGYQQLFIVMAVFAIVGLIASIILGRMVKKHKAEKAAEPEGDADVA